MVAHAASSVLHELAAEVPGALRNDRIVVVSVSEDVVLASEDVASVEDSEESTAAVMVLDTDGDQNF